MANLLSWGRYPQRAQCPTALGWRADVADVWQRGIAAHRTTLAYGNGRSYGDSCLAASNQVLHTVGLNRFLSADWDTGRIVVEAGVTFEQILALAIPRGWMLPVTPGTKYLTVGGAIANDVHGKNHHVRGTFGRHVSRLMLLRSDGRQIACTADPAQATDEQRTLFAATVGGLGLTGLILWAEIQLFPIASSNINVTSIRFDGIDDFFRLSEERDPLHEYSVAWIDCQSRGAALGRGIFMVGDHALSGPLVADTRKKQSVPLTPPVSVFNRLTLKTLNELYYRRQPAGPTRSTVGYDSYFYPLDRLLNWNRIYGPAGFQQYQCVIPQATSRAAIREILDAIARSGTGSFLAVLKRCGAIMSPGLLSFPMEGTSLALDFPQIDGKTSALFASLDDIVRQAGGRLYPAKDAHMTADDFKAAYPNWAMLERHRDPALLSQFWERTTQ